MPDKANIDVKLEDTPVSIVAGKKLRVQRSGWSTEHPVGSQARKNAVARITKMHNVYHVNNEILEKVILATRGHDCKPGDTRYLGPCSRCSLRMRLSGSASC